MEKCKKCKKCDKDFNPKKGLKNYCSLQCRNSRTWTKEDKDKKSNSAKKSIKVQESIKKCRENINWEVIKKKRNETIKNKILLEEYNNLSFDRLRKRIIYEQNEKCNVCGLDKWLNKPLILELEHKDGDRNNNNRNNLEALCPNCHSLTNTWRGRNKKTNKHKISDEVLLNSLIKNNFNMRKSLIEVGLVAKGGNYNRCHRLKKEYLDIIE